MLLSRHDHRATALFAADLAGRASMIEKPVGLKNDPARRDDLYGPVEQSALLKTGRLPEAYYDKDNDTPWGLLPDESRSNILWQVTAGLLDKQPEFAAAYLALALDKGLKNDDYAKELKTLNDDWKKHLSQLGAAHDHVHGAMTKTYNRVSCPACSMLTSLACRDAGVYALFQEMLSLKPADRRIYLQDRGLTPLLYRIVQNGPASAPKI
jgi:hypothetical protein